MAQVHADESISKVAFWPLWIAGRLIGTVLFLSFFAVVIFVSAQHWKWPVRVDGSIQTVTPAYLLALQDRAMRQAEDSSAANRLLATKFAVASYGLYFKLTGLHQAILTPDDTQMLSRMGKKYSVEVAAGMIGAQIFGARLANAILMLPMILTVVLLATVDGIAERAIRRACAGHESATIFRLTRRFAYKLLPPAVGLIYLCLPYDLQAGDVLLPALAVTAILVRTKWKYYKKHV